MRPIRAWLRCEPWNNTDSAELYASLRQFTNPMYRIDYLSFRIVLA